MAINVIEMFYKNYIWIEIVNNISKSENLQNIVNAMMGHVSYDRQAHL